MKRLMLVWLMILCLLPVGGWAEETADALYPIRENGLWGYMNRAGEVVIEPQFAEAEPFRGGYAVVLPVTLCDSQCTWRGIIDKSGNWVFPPDGSEIISLDSSSRYIGGYDDGIYIIYSPDSKMYGFFDISSGFYSGQCYQWIDRNCDPDEEMICVACNNGKGFASRATGDIVISCRYELDYSYRFENGYCRVLPIDAEVADGWILIDRQGNEVLMPENCYACGSVGDGLVPIWDSETELCGYMDLAGNIVIEPQYEWAYPFSEGRACVYRDNDEEWSWIVITQNNKPIVILEDDALDCVGSNTVYMDGLLRVAHYDDDYNLVCIYYLDKDGNESFRLEIDNLLDVSDFNEIGIAYYMTGNETVYGTYENVQYGFFNDHGEILTQPVYIIAANNWSEGFSEGFLPVTFIEYGDMGYVDDRGWTAYPILPVFDRAKPFRNGLAMVEKSGVLGYIDSEAVVIWQEDELYEPIPLYIGDRETQIRAILCGGTISGYYALIPFAQTLEAMGYPLNWESETVATALIEDRRYILDTEAGTFRHEEDDWSLFEVVPGTAGHLAISAGTGMDFVVDSEYCLLAFDALGFIDQLDHSAPCVRIVQKPAYQTPTRP